MNEIPLVIKYQELLENADRPHVILTQFLCELLSITKESKIYSFLGKMVKLYGASSVFNGICSLSVYEVKENFFPLLNTIVKNMSEESRKNSVPKTLDLKERNKFLEQFKGIRIEIGDEFDD